MLIFDFNLKKKILELVSKSFEFFLKKEKKKKNPELVVVVVMFFRPVQDMYI